LEQGKEQENAKTKEISYGKNEVGLPCKIELEM